MKFAEGLGVCDLSGSFKKYSVSSVPSHLNNIRAGFCHMSGLSCDPIDLLSKEIRINGVSYD